MNNIKLFLLLGLLFTLFGCNKQDVERTPIPVALTLENDSDYDIESFEMTIADNEDNIQVVTFGPLIKKEKSAPEFVEALAYAYEQHASTSYYFGHEFKIVVEGVKYDLNYGICGTGLSYDHTEEGTFNTKISYLDLAEGFFGIHQTKD